MQLYRVALMHPSRVEPDQNVRGYLGHNGETCLYTRGEAIKKARVFGGKIEKYGKDYVANELKMIQLSKQELSPEVQRQLDGLEAYMDFDDEPIKKIYFGDVFQLILNTMSETDSPAISPDHMHELIVLNNICASYEYLLIVSNENIFER